MKFLVDNALSPQIAVGLRHAGYDSVHVRDIQLQTALDQEILAVAVRDDRIVVSADTDFGTLLAKRETTKPSFILMRGSDKRPDIQLKLLLANLPQLGEALQTGAIVVFEDTRIRVRPLPVGKAKD